LPPIVSPSIAANTEADNSCVSNINATTNIAVLVNYVIRDILLTKRKFKE
jgi:hypothetical protein